MFPFSDCNAKSCSGDIVPADSGFYPFLDFNRTLTWNLKAAGPKAIQIEFTKMGLRQIYPSLNCPDGHTFTLKAFQATGNAVIGKYCRIGTISSAQILNQGSFSLDVPAGQKLHNVQFDVSVGEEIKCKLLSIQLLLCLGSQTPNC